MFSSDKDEVADLFQDILIRTANASRAASVCR